MHPSAFRPFDQQIKQEKKKIKQNKSYRYAPVVCVVFTLCLSVDKDSPAQGAHTAQCAPWFNHHYPMHCIFYKWIVYAI